MGFQTGLSGLNAASRNLDVIGHNVANANTYGAKASRAEFADMYANSMNGTGNNHIGIGVRLATVTQQFTPGNITPTDNPMDLAINGAGFFQVADARGALMYTRNGQFQVDREGYVTTSDGMKLLGYGATVDGQIVPSQAGPIKLPTAGLEPRKTSSIAMELNLDPRQPEIDPAVAFDPDDPESYNNATSMTLFDTKGQPVAATFYFRKNDTGDWDVYATANGEQVNGGNVLTNIQFPEDGSAPSQPTGSVALTIPATAPDSSGETLQIDDIALDLRHLTEYAANFAVTDQRQDGYAPGQLAGIDIDENGVVLARYTNRQSKPAGQVELANFRNPQGLQPMGGNNWVVTHASGGPVLGTPGDGNLGLLQSGALEESNVDLTAELVNMITAQRHYQANAQTIKTEDQLMQTIVNLR